MADTEHIAIVELGVGDAPAGLVLSTEAHWNQNEADWRFFLSKGIVFGVRDEQAAGRDRSAAALLIRQCLDQHGAGDRKLAPPRHCDQAGRCLPRRGDQARPHHLARCDAGRRHRLWPARLYADAAIAAAAAAGSGRRRAPRHRYRTCSVADFIARDRHAMGFDRSAAADGICRAPRLPHRVASATPWPWSATDAPRAISARCLRTTHEDALALVDAIVRSEQGPWLLDAVHSQDEFLRGPHRLRLDHRAAVPAHAVRPRHHDAARAAVRGRRPGIWIGIAPCTTARSNPRSGS